jgi:hypothetical protein
LVVLVVEQGGACPLTSSEIWTEAAGSSKVAHGFFIDKVPWALKVVHGFFFDSVGAYPHALSNSKTFRKEDAVLEKRAVEEVG